MDLSLAFVIFFITIGPLKVIPSFYLKTSELSKENIRSVAVRAVLYSFIILLLVAVVADQMLKAWQLSLPALVLAGGIILFLASIKTIGKYKGVKFLPIKTLPINATSLSNDDISQMALSPVAIPLIISSTGIVAVIAIVSLAHIHDDILKVIGLLLIIMVMNLLSMIFARFIMSKIGFAVYSIIGWVFSILQAGLAVQIVVNSIHKLFEI